MITWLRGINTDQEQVSDTGMSTVRHVMVLVYIYIYIRINRYIQIYLYIGRDEQYWPVEKYQLLFSENDKDGVSQLGQLWQHEHPGPEPAHPVSLDKAEKYISRTPDSDVTGLRPGTAKGRRGERQSGAIPSQVPSMVNEQIYVTLSLTRRWTYLVLRRTNHRIRRAVYGGWCGEVYHHLLAAAVEVCDELL